MLRIVQSWHNRLANIPLYSVITKCIVKVIIKNLIS